MPRKLATIQQIEEMQPIENADKIERVRVGGWWCVTQKSNNFKSGDLVVYFEIDSLLPVTNPTFEFLSSSSKPKDAVINGEDKIGYGYRLKTVKLRGQISQGLVIPIKELFPTKSEIAFKIGDDVSSDLGIVKYESPIPVNLAGKVKGRFPIFLPKTDEERVQNLSEVIEKNKNKKVYVSEKIDGSSVSFYKHNGEFGVCSRNLELVDAPDNTLWEMGRKYKLSEKIPEGYAIQAEIVGEGIQKNPLKLKGQDIYVFNVYDIRRSAYLDFEMFISFCKELDLKTVPIVDVNWSLYGEIDTLLKYAEGPSLLNDKAEREGLVFRPLKEELMDIDGILQRFSFKAISNKYLLKNE